MKPSEIFAIRAKNFILKNCRQRLYLLSSGKSKLNDDTVYDTAKGLMNEIQTLFTDQQLAAFLHKKEGDILSLLPGKNCKGIETRLKKLHELNFESKQILNPQS